MKAIVIIRTSTDKQEVESQKKEVIELAKSDGFTEDNIIVIGDKGASAIKEDEKYKQNISLLKSYITSDKDISCVYAWAIDRLGRREVTLFELKEYLINHKVNLIIKNPSLVLFNPDGSVNSGMEIAFSLFATMSKQEMEMKNARFKRAKDRMRAEGKWVGGKLGYGYVVDSNGYIVLDKNEAKILKEMYELYSTGKYSSWTLYEELTMRGYKDRGNRLFNFNRIAKLLRNPRYKELVGEDIWNKCEEVRKGRIQDTTKTRESKYIHYGIGLIVCTECGHKFTADGHRYRCTHDNKKFDDCNVGIGMNIEGLDNILEEAITPIHEKYMSELGKESIKEFTEKIAILEKKVEVLREKLYDIPMRKRRVQEGYENNIYNEKEWKDKIARLTKEGIDLQAKISIALDEIENYRESIEDLSSGSGTTETLDYGMKEDRRLRMKEIIHRHTKLIHVYRVKPEEEKQYGKMGVRIEIILKNGETLWYIYNNRKKMAIREK